MTAQIHDTVSWQGVDHSLVGVDGEGLFDPIHHGLRTQPTTTANWRGWVAAYAVRDDALVLASLRDVGLTIDEGDPAPEVNGVAGVTDRGFSFEFRDVNLPLAFSGRLHIARGFIQELYVHMGFHPAWKYEHSWELAFDGGRLTEARDTSAEMRVVRKRLSRRGDPEVGRPGWIQRAFGLGFRRSRGEREP